jgi:ribonuclease-3
LQRRIGDLAQLERSIQYHFRDRKLIQQALTHSSYRYEAGLTGDNERLEFLGDTVLDLIISEYLYQRFPESNEGVLAKARASLVCSKNLARHALALSLGKYLLLGRGEDKSGGRRRASLLANTLEAVIAAVYLDGGYEACRHFVLRLFDEDLPDKLDKTQFLDPKSALQEYSQTHYHVSPEYRLKSSWGPDHAKLYAVQACVKAQVVGEGMGRSRKAAEQSAALQAWKTVEQWSKEFR